ncbi:MAG: energy transducer TonB [Bacteroidota bacterium]
MKNNFNIQRFNSPLSKWAWGILQCFLFLCFFSCSKLPEQKTEANTVQQANEQTSKPINEPTKPIDPTTLADTVELTTLKQWPTPTQQFPPVYPDEARMNGIKAEVMLKVLIGIDGRPRAAEVQRVNTGSIYHDSTKSNVETYHEFEEMFKQPSIDAVMSWQFTKPLKHTGEPANVWVNVPLQYNLTK